MCATGHAPRRSRLGPTELGPEFVGSASTRPAATNTSRSVDEIRTWLPILWKGTRRSAMSRRTKRSPVPRRSAASSMVRSRSMRATVNPGRPGSRPRSTRVPGTFTIWDVPDPRGGPGRPGSARASGQPARALATCADGEGWRRRPGWQPPRVTRQGARGRARRPLRCASQPLLVAVAHRVAGRAWRGCLRPRNGRCRACRASPTATTAVSPKGDTPVWDGDGRLVFWGRARRPGGCWSTLSRSAACGVVADKQG